MTGEQFSIIPASQKDLPEIEKLQGLIWGFNETEIVGVSLLLDILRNGGIILLAKNHKKEIVGFLMGFVGLDRDNKIFHYSDMMGVLPKYRSMGVGFQLKMEQKKVVESQGLDLIKWTFDPLESRNARLNITKLGGLSRNYNPNLFGSNVGRLNAGLDTDRLVVEWWIKSPHVEERLSNFKYDSGLMRFTKPDFSIANDTDNRSNTLKISNIRLNLTDPKILVEIPDNIQNIKIADINLAKEWRIGIRSILQHYFSENYIITDFFSDHQSGNRRRNFYLLEIGKPTG